MMKMIGRARVSKMVTRAPFMDGPPLLRDCR
jgi:hypothetical protein